jgi:hypothetical protein
VDPVFERQEDQGDVVIQCRVDLDQTCCRSDQGVAEKDDQYLGGWLAERSRHVLVVQALKVALYKVAHSNEHPTHRQHLASLNECRGYLVVSHYSRPLTLSIHFPMVRGVRNNEERVVFGLDIHIANRRDKDIPGDLPNSGSDYVMLRVEGLEIFYRIRRLPFLLERQEQFVHILHPAAQQAS